MFFDLDSTQGEWFPFFSSHIDPVTGEPIYEDPHPDAKVQIRSIGPFIEERIAKRKKVAEHVYNPKTRAMERISYYPDQTLEETKAERDDLWDYAITGLENFKDSKTGEPITCTRENKLKLMKVPVFDRFVARCQQLLASSGVKAKEDEEKN
jgi:hypothetical protein